MSTHHIYHWSPVDRRKAILQQGIVLLAPATIHSSDGLCYLCFGPTPSFAWSLSAGYADGSEAEEWDLWQVTVDDNDEVHVMPRKGPHPHEIRIYNSVPPDRVFWCGCRGYHPNEN